MPRYKAAQREHIVAETRQLLLQAAAEEFAREGYNGANINRISQQAGFAKGTIYNYFPSKRALMLALIDDIAASHVAAVAEDVLQEDDPVRRLQSFFEAGFAFVSTHLDELRTIATTLYGPDEEFKGRMWQAYQPMFELVGRDIMAAGIAQGQFKPHDVDATTALLMTIYLGTGSQVDDQGRMFLSSQEVANFCLDALRS